MPHGAPRRALIVLVVGVGLLVVVLGALYAGGAFCALHSRCIS